MTPPAVVARLTANAGVKRCLGVMALVLTAALIMLGLFGPAQGDQRAGDGGDRGFYARIIDQVHAGQPYDQAVIQDLRAADGPARPFLTVRPPLLTMAMAVLPDAASRTLSLRLLAATVLLAWFWRLRAVSLEIRHGWLLLLALTSGVGIALSPTAYLMHEAWAGLLIALSLALRTPERWLTSVLVATLAALIRELAAAYLLVMIVFALAERRPKEVLGWTLGLVVFAAALARHAQAVNALLLPTDHASPGWLKLGGWPFVLHAASWNLATIFCSPWVLASVFPLALLGLAAWRDALGRRVALTVFGYVIAFMVAGRAVNFYWGLIMAPLWPLGVAMAPSALALAWRWLGVGGAGRIDPQVSPADQPQTAVAVVR